MVPPNVLSGGINFRLSAGKVQFAGGIALGLASLATYWAITQSTDFNFNSTWIVAGSNNIKSFDGTTLQPCDIP